MPESHVMLDDYHFYSIRDDCYEVAAYYNGNALRSFQEAIFNEYFKNIMDGLLEDEWYMKADIIVEKSNQGDAYHIDVIGVIGFRQYKSAISVIGKKENGFSAIHYALNGLYQVCVEYVDKVSQELFEDAACEPSDFPIKHDDDLPQEALPSDVEFELGSAVDSLLTDYDEGGEKYSPEEEGGDEDKGDSPK